MFSAAPPGARRSQRSQGRPQKAPAEVTTFDPGAETDPRDVGMTRDGVASIWRAVERFYESGLSPAIALCIRRNGRVVLDRAIGHARGAGPGDAPEEEPVLATPRTLFPIFSASKAITAMLVHLLDERHLIHLDDPVDEYIPGFGKNGKSWITIRHVLTHRAGIPIVPGEHARLELLTDTQRIVEILSEARPMLRPGRRLAYHALTGGFVLAEVIRRVTGRDVQTFLRDEVRRPLGLQHMGYGVEAQDLPQVARSYHTGPPVVFPFSFIVKRALGVRFEEAVRISNDPRFLTGVIPAGNIIGTANEVSRFFQLLLDGGEQGGVRIFSPLTIRRAIGETSYLELDLTLGVPVRYSLGLMLGSKVLSPYGPGTQKAFGHVGFTNVIAWADRARETSVCLMTSGKPFITPRLFWLVGVLTAINRHCPAA